MTPQIRTYILAVGRDMEDKPVRKIAAYRGRPLKGMGDNWHIIHTPDLLRIETELQAESQAIFEALVAIHDEKLDRLARQVGYDNKTIRELMEAS